MRDPRTSCRGCQRRGSRFNLCTKACFCLGTQINLSTRYSEGGVDTSNFDAAKGQVRRAEGNAGSGNDDTLYPDGFSDERFAEVIEAAVVWAGRI